MENKKGMTYVIPFTFSSFGFGFIYLVLFTIPCPKFTERDLQREIYRESVWEISPLKCSFTFSSKEVHVIFELQFEDKIFVDSITGIRHTDWVAE